MKVSKLANAAAQKAQSKNTRLTFTVGGLQDDLEEWTMLRFVIQFVPNHLDEQNQTQGHDSDTQDGVVERIFFLFSVARIFAHEPSIVVLLVPTAVHAIE
jgi:hypothetical protein